jgi:hypothetical protein
VQAETHLRVVVPIEEKEVAIQYFAIKTELSKVL